MGWTNVYRLDGTFSEVSLRRACLPEYGFPFWMPGEASSTDVGSRGAGVRAYAPPGQIGHERPKLVLLPANILVAKRGLLVGKR